MSNSKTAKYTQWDIIKLMLLLIIVVMILFFLLAIYPPIDQTEINNLKAQKEYEQYQKFKMKNEINRDFENFIHGGKI